MPIAVMIESSENTRSIRMSCATTVANDCAAIRLAELVSSPRGSTSWWISCVVLAIRNSPPPIRMISRQEMPMRKIGNSE
jgi:hypothetical protein